MRLSQRDFSAEELRWLKENTKRQSRQFSARMLAVADDKTYLARLRAVDENYPLFGTMQLQSGEKPTTALAAKAENGVYPALIAKELLVLLDIQIGDSFNLGGLRLRAVDVVEKNPTPIYACGLARRWIWFHRKYWPPGGLISSAHCWIDMCGWTYRWRISEAMAKPPTQSIPQRRLER